jgi:hypothetical protein
VSVATSGSDGATVVKALVGGEEVALEAAQDGRYVGTLTVPEGQQTLTFRSFADLDGDGTLEALAEDTTVVDVNADAPSAVFLRRGAALIRSLTFGGRPVAGQPVSIAVNATYLDGTPAEVTWWSDTCVFDFGFTDNSSRSGTVTFTQPGPCAFLIWTTSGPTFESFPMSVDVLAP